MVTYPREEHKLRLLENRVLRIVLGHSGISNGRILEIVVNVRAS